MQHLNRKVKKDLPIKNLVLKTALSAYTSNPLNLGLKGPSSTGKTYTTMQVLKYFPEKDVWLLGGMSKKALIHSYGVLCDENGNEINLLEKPTRDSVKQELRDFYNNVPEQKVTSSMISDELHRQKQLWKEKLDKARYIVNLKNKILVFLEAPDIEVFKILRPVLSHDAKEISYKIADKNSAGSLQTKHVIIKNWPATIFCTTDLDFLEDISTRSITATPEISQEKFQLANELTGTKEAFPWEFQQDRDFDLLSGYIHWLGSKIQDVKVVVPFGEDLGKAYPAYYARSMRDLPHFLSLIKVSALFHYAQRPVLKIGEKEYLLATQWDYDHISETWLDIEETTLTGLPGHILNFYHKAVETLAETEDSFSYEDLTLQYNTEANERKSSDTIRKWVKMLSEIGWVTKNPDPVDKRKVKISIIKKAENNGDCRLPEFNSFFSKEKLENWLDRVKKMSAETPVQMRENFLSDYIKESIDDMPINILQSYFFIYKERNFSPRKPSSSSDIFSEQSEPKTSPKQENNPKKDGFRESPIKLPKMWNV